MLLRYYYIITVRFERDLYKEKKKGSEIPKTPKVASKYVTTHGDIITIRFDVRLRIV